MRKPTAAATTKEARSIEHPIQVRLAAMSMSQERRLTQKWLARKAGLHESVISAYIHKRLILMPNTLHAICIRRALEIDANYQLAMGQEYWRDYRMVNSRKPLSIIKKKEKVS